MSDLDTHRMTTVTLAAHARRGLTTLGSSDCFILAQNNDKAGVSLHNGVWAPLFVMGAGTCM